MNLIMARGPDDEPKQLIINNCRRRSRSRRRREIKKEKKLQKGYAITEQARDSGFH